MATSSSKFHIPTVDISPYRRDPTSRKSLEIIDQVRTACITTGFFQLIGHGVSAELQKAVFEGSAAFFQLPLEEKKRLDKDAVGRKAKNHGYEVIGTQGLQEGLEPDLKEGFYIGQHIPSTDPRALAHPTFIGPNLWPACLSAEIFQQPMEKYYDEMFALSLVVLDILARGLPYRSDIFADFTSNDPVASIRLLHYPPQLHPSENQLGAGAHTDFGAITLLLQDETPGLQVLDPHSSEWVPIEPNAAAYVVNVGDMLCQWTKGVYKSSLHRVLNVGGRDRYSIPFFFDGNMECRLDPFDGGDIGEGGAATVEEHMEERFASTYGRGKVVV